jgi:hypothetical protein
MKMNVAFYFIRKTIVAPQVCCRCLNSSVTNHDELLCLEQKGHFLQSYKFKFPYCHSCYENIRKKRLFKGKARAVDVSNVMTKKYGKILRKQTLSYVEFNFKNDQYGQLFKEANRELLLENVLAELQAQTG